jgi:hypothetical protein
MPHCRCPIEPRIEDDREDVWGSLGAERRVKDGFES